MCHPRPLTATAEDLLESTSTSVSFSRRMEGKLNIYEDVPLPWILQVAEWEAETEETFVFPTAVFCSEALNKDKNKDKDSFLFFILQVSVWGAKP